MNRQTILGVVRHGLTAAGGALVAQGLGDEDIIQEAIGVIIAIVGLVWSIVEKRARQGSPGGSSPTFSDPGL